MRDHAVRLILAAALVMAAAAPAHAQPQTPVTIFAAASLKSALDAVDASVARRAGLKVAASYAATPALVRQIEQGAPADVLATADTDWMDHATRHKLIGPASRVNLLGNRLVLIAARDSRIASVTLAPGVELAQLAGKGRIAIGEVTAVPAGRYAATALRSLGIWSTVEHRLAMMENVRAALTLVARGEAPLGIVYATDAMVEPAVRIVGQFPADTHPPIIYPVAAVAGARTGARGYLDMIQSTAAKAIFEQHGFSFLIQPTP